jgi:hypothetical protein
MPPGRPSSDRGPTITARDAARAVLVEFLQVANGEKGNRDRRHSALACAASFTRRISVSGRGQQRGNGLSGRQKDGSDHVDQLKLTPTPAMGSHTAARLR